MNKFKPDQMVKCCNNIERGVRFDKRGVGVCCCSTKSSPCIITNEEMASGKVDYDFILKRRHELLECVNGQNNKWDVSSCLECELLKEKRYKDIDLSYLGGQNMCSGFNIAHFSSCNLKCIYCDYASIDKETNNKYSNIIEFIEEYSKRGKLIKDSNVDYNGGEPTLLKDFEKILNYLIKSQIKNITLYSNCVKYSPAIYNALKYDKIALITSPDSALPSTFKRVKTMDSYRKVWDNIVRYRNSGTSRLIVKYVITDENRSDDDLYAFATAAAALGPKVTIGICPAYPLGNIEIPAETVEFGAKLYYALEKYTGKAPLLFSDYATADIKFANYSRDVRKLVNKLKDDRPISYEFYNLNQAPIDANYCAKESIIVKFEKLYCKIKKFLKYLIYTMKN